MELVSLGERTYVIPNATNIGVYLIDDYSVYLIDTGNDKDAGKKILKVIEDAGWKVKGIISTHSHADHIGGNKVIQDRTGCVILAKGIEKVFISHPLLEPSFLYGGYPFHSLTNKFLCAKSSDVSDIDHGLPEGLCYFTLPGHSFDMIGIQTSDNVYFVADALCSLETIEKYHVFFLYDVASYLSTLSYLETLKGGIFVPSHGKVTKDISTLLSCNRQKIQEICETICQYCGDGITFEQLLKKIFDHYQLTMDENQFVLVGSTIRSYLSYLYEEGKVTYQWVDNQMIWKVIG